MMRWVHIILYVLVLYSECHHLRAWSCSSCVSSPSIPFFMFQVINFYMNLLVERSQKPNLPTVNAFNTFFYPKLRKSGYCAVRRWTKKMDIFSKDILLVPVHLGVHWCLSVSLWALPKRFLLDLHDVGVFPQIYMYFNVILLYFSGGGFPQKVRHVLWFHGRKKRRGLQSLVVSIKHFIIVYLGFLIH